MLNLTTIRSDTPAADQQLFLLSAGSSLPPRPVTAAMLDHLRLEEAVGGYDALEQRQEQQATIYSSIARLINAQPAEIAIVGNATLAWQAAFYSFRFSAGDRILTCQSEYAANYVAYLQVAQRTGATIGVIPNTPEGELDPAALERMLDDQVKLISINWVPTNGGLVNPAAEVGRIARAHGVPYLLDACQAVGQIAVDVVEIGCDFLTATGRKFLRGPRGTGFLYCRREMLERCEPAMIDHFAAPWLAPDRYQVRDDARRFETWENNYAARAGLGAAVDYTLAIGMEAIEGRCRELASRLRQGLAALRGVTIHDLGHAPCAIVSFTVDNMEAQKIVKAASEQKIRIGSSQPSSTLLDATARRLPPLVRVSPHYFNTEQEIDNFVTFCARVI
jgi:selenocysteine lyase/cysteine desulfurase